MVRITKGRVTCPSHLGLKGENWPRRTRLLLIFHARGCPTIQHGSAEQVLADAARRRDLGCSAGEPASRSLASIFDEAMAASSGCDARWEFVQRFQMRQCPPDRTQAYKAAA